MKEKEIYLTLEEIDYLLKGMVHWEEIESRLNASPRKPIEPMKMKSSFGKSEPLNRRPFSKNRTWKEPIHEDSLELPPQMVEQSVTQVNETAEKKMEALSKPFLEGKPVYWVLAGVGILTLGIWVYFVFA